MSSLKKQPRPHGRAVPQEEGVLGPATHCSSLQLREGGEGAKAKSKKGKKNDKSETMKSDVES